MRKSLSVVLTLSLITTGVALEVMAVTSGMLSRESNRSTTLYALGGCFLALLLLGVVFPLFADNDYKRVVRYALLLLALGMMMIYIFLGFMWMVVGSSAVSVLMKVFLLLYGVALVMAGLFNHFASQGAYRPYIYNMAREFPYLYYRYRI